VCLACMYLQEDSRKPTRENKVPAACARCSSADTPTRDKKKLLLKERTKRKRQMFVHRITSNRLRRVGLGSSGVFFVGGGGEKRKKTEFVFKPIDEENTHSRMGLKRGDGMIREIAAYEIDRRSESILRAGVPKTVAAIVSSNTIGSLRGSLQKYADHEESSEDMSPSKYSIDQVHRIGVLDIRLFNLDRHPGNMLVTKRNTDLVRLTPIDHGLILPPITQLSEAEFSWLWWPQAKVPFSPEVRDAILNLSVLRDTSVLRTYGFEESCILTLLLCQQVLKRMVSNGLTLYEIARIFVRTSLDVPSAFEMFVRNIVLSASLNSLRESWRLNKKEAGVMTTIEYDFRISMFARILNAVAVFSRPPNILFVGDGIRVACWM
jgi:hypothetical protein